MSELYDIDKLPGVNFPLSFKLIDRYQKEYPFLQENFTCANNRRGYFFWGQNTIELVTYNNKIVIPKQLQKYVVNWYHTYLIHPLLYKTEAMIFQNI